MKPKKWTCRHEVVAAFTRLEQRERRVEFHLEEAVAEVWAVTHRYTKATIRTCVASQICANARPNHSVHHHDLERVGPGLYRRCVAAWSPRPLPPGQSDLVAREFHAALEQLCRRCERDLHFTPNWLRKMLPRVGGVETARRYVCTTATEPELDQLWHLGCLHESVEALMLHPRFAPLFTDAELKAAQRRLRARGANITGPRGAAQHNPTQLRPFRPWSEIEAQYGD